MRVRALVVIATLPVLIAAAPAAAHAQRVTTSRCWTGSDWRYSDACSRSHDVEAARAARREASEERARLRAMDNVDRVARAREQRLEHEASARERRLESAERAREVAREASARAEERAMRNADRRREQLERTRERAHEREIERSFDRPVHYQRWP